LSTNASLRRSLRVTPGLTSLSSQVLDRLVHQMDCKKYQPDDVLWRTRHNIDFLGVIQSGEVLIEHRMENQVIHSTRLRAGDVVKPGDLKCKENHAYVLARAVTDVSFFVLQKGQIAELQLDLPISENISPSSPWNFRWNMLLVVMIISMILITSWKDLSRIASAGLFYLSDQTKTSPPDYLNSLRLLQYAKFADPTAAFPYNAEGDIWSGQNNLSRAEVALGNAIRIEQNNVHALNNLGVLYFKTENFQQALLNQQRAVQFEPNNPVVHYNLGVSLMQNRSASEAIREFKEVSHIAPGWDLPYLQLAYLHIEMQDFDTAEQEAQKAVSLEPDQQTSHLLLAIALYNQGRYQEALKSIEKALQINHDNDVARFYQALVLVRLKKFDDALSILQQLLDSTDDQQKISRITAEINGLQRMMQSP
jgi:tetratricopeptide (TPR) repeat protein